MEVLFALVVERGRGAMQIISSATFDVCIQPRPPEIYTEKIVDHSIRVYWTAQVLKAVSDGSSALFKTSL